MVIPVTSMTSSLREESGGGRGALRSRLSDAAGDRWVAGASLRDLAAARALLVDAGLPARAWPAAAWMRRLRCPAVGLTAAILTLVGGPSNVEKVMDLSSAAQPGISGDGAGFGEYPLVFPPSLPHRGVG